MLRKGMILLAISLAISIPAFAQGTEGRFGGADNDAPGVDALESVNERRPLLLSGNVVLSSGEPLSEPILIKRICGTRVIPEGYTNAKGSFLFEIGGTGALAVMDSSSAGLGESVGDSFGGLGKGDTTTTGMDFTGCTIVPEAPGFRTSPIVLGRRRSLDRSDIGTFILTPLEGAQGTTISATSVAAPKKAQTAYFKALEMLREVPAARTDKAIAELEKAIKIYPEYAAAWTALGQAKLQMGDTNGAKSALEKSIATDPQYIRPYSPLTRIAVGAQDWARTVELADVVLSADPTNTQISWFRAVAQFELRELDDAAASLSALQTDEAAERQFPQSHHLLGMIYASRGEIGQAASEYQRYVELAPEAPAVEGIKQQLNEWRQQGSI
jgi:cytochrome c-type biogenesis protein CcmH/NrfG